MLCARKPGIIAVRVEHDFTALGFLVFLLYGAVWGQNRGLGGKRKFMQLNVQNQKKTKIWTMKKSTIYICLKHTPLLVYLITTLSTGPIELSIVRASSS